MRQKNRGKALLNEEEDNFFFQKRERERKREVKEDLEADITYLLVLEEMGKVLAISAIYT